MTVRAPAILLSLAMFAGCAHVTADRAPTFRFESGAARLVSADIVVLPAIVSNADPTLDDGLFGAGPVPLEAQDLRADRDAQVRTIGDLFGWAVPGALSAALHDQDFDPSWSVGKWPAGAAPRVSAVLRGRGLQVAKGPTDDLVLWPLEDEEDFDDVVVPPVSYAYDHGAPGALDAALTDTARAGGGRPVLVTWVRGLSGSPLTNEFIVGEVTFIGEGPVVVTLEEPYRVSGRFGLALVAPDGEVLVRYEEPFEAVLSDTYGPGRIARDVARDLAVEVARFWPVDPEAVVDGGDLDLP